EPLPSAYNSPDRQAAANHLPLLSDCGHGPGWNTNMRWMTRILLVAIFLVPILWVWPQRGITMAFYANPGWSNDPVLVRAERTISLDFMTADSTSFPQQQFSVEW